MLQDVDAARNGLLAVSQSLHLLHQCSKDALGHCCNGLPAPDVAGQMSARMRVGGWLGGTKFPVRGCASRFAVWVPAAPDLDVS